MAAAAKADAPRSTSVDSYMGSLISLVTKSDIRYEGFVYHLSAQETTIGLRNVKSFGTEGRRKDGSQVPPSTRIYDYICFRGSDLKDLQVLSSPPVPSAPSVPDDPAIIRTHFSPPPSAPGSSSNAGASQVSSITYSAQSRVPISCFQGNHSLHSSDERPGSWGLSLPPVPLGISRPAMPTYWHGIPSSSASVFQFQQHNLPPLPQGLMASHPVQQQTNSSNINAHIAPNSSNLVEPHRHLVSPMHAGSQRGLTPVPSSPAIGSPNGLPLVSSLSATGSRNGFLHMPPSLASGSQDGFPPVPPPSASHSNFGLFSMPAFNIAPSSQSNITSTSPAMPVNLNSQLVTPPAVSTNVSTVTTLATEAASSVPAATYHYPSMFLSAKPNKENKSESVDKTPEKSSDQLLQQDLLVPPSFYSLQTTNVDSEPVQVSVSEALPLELGNAEEPPNQTKRPQAKTMHGAASSSHYHNRNYSRGTREEAQKDVSHGRHTNKGFGRGRANVPNEAVSHTDFHNGSYAKAKERGVIGSSHSFHSSRSLGRECVPTNRQGRGYLSGGSNASPVEKYTEDFNFEAMNEKFNKEEVWGLLGKSVAAGSEDENGNGEEATGIDATELVDGLPKVDDKPVYCKDDFFDSISCNTLDHKSGRGRVKFSDQRRLDTETFGEINKHQRGRGIQGPRRAGGSQGSFRGRGSDNAKRGRGRTAWSRVT